MTEGRKVLFIIIDQLRADCVSGALAAHVDLPNIAALQADAVTFTNHFSVTNPCGPSRASIFTGRYAMNHRSLRNGTPLSASMTNIALEMRKGGYEPWLFGYTDTSMDPRGRAPADPDLRTEENLLPGFREMLEMRFMSSYPWRAHLGARGYDLPPYGEFFHPVPAQPGSPPRPDDPAFYRAEDSDTAFLTDEFLKHMAVRTRDNWFALVTYIRPHPPLVAPAPYNRMYRGADLPLPVRKETRQEEMDVHPFIAAAARYAPMERSVPGCADQVDARQDADVQTLRAVYFGLASEVDAHVGRIMDFLKSTGQYDQTLIVLQADHGEMLGDHHMWGKHHVYDPAFRIPLIIRDPASSARFGTRVDALTESIDITPTILELTGQKVPREMDGVSLKPFLEGKTPGNWRDCVHLELDFGEPGAPTIWQKELGLSLREANLAIIREKRFKLVHFNAGLPPLLFDLQNDPGELENLAADPAHAPTLLRLTQKLLSLRMRHADRTLSDVRLTGQGPVNFAL